MIGFQQGLDTLLHLTETAQRIGVGLATLALIVGTLAVALYPRRARR